ncbi:MAG TPA: PP2C family protein-serine/threonine phosphatase [Acidimicrobiales bacterium]
MVDPDHPEWGLPTNLSELSRVLPVAGLEIRGRYQAADLDVRAGGDFFDVFPLGPERTAIIIGDIAGHGRAAAEASRSVRALVHRVLARAAGPADVLIAVEAALVADGAATMVTLLCAEIDTGQDLVRMASAGHCWPVVRRGSGLVEQLRRPPAPPLGLGLLDPAGARPDEWAVPFVPGDLAVLYTDGLVERRRIPLDSVLGWVQDAVAEHGEPGELCRQLLHVAAIQRDHDDDIAVLIVRRAIAADADDRIHPLEERV